jgi:hypothetical protein
MWAENFLYEHISICNMEVSEQTVPMLWNFMMQADFKEHTPSVMGGGACCINIYSRK